MSEEENEATDTYWFRSGTNRAEAQFKLGYMLGDVHEQAQTFARKWGVTVESVTYGLVSVAVD
jgi:hypothetical protein